MRHLYRATTATAGLLVLLGGCAASGAGVESGQPTSSHAMRCTAADLHARFWGTSEPGTGGTALGRVLLWDKSPAACRLAGPVTVIGLGRFGQLVTTPAKFSLPARPSPALLSANGTGPNSLGLFQPGERSASLLLVATGAHPAGGLPCAGHQVRPAGWRVDIGTGSVTARNASPASGPALTADGGLVTCRGRLGGQSPLLVSRIPS